MEKVVIIGSGLGGLTCADILQKNGFSVTVLEMEPHPGGCLQCFTRKGAKFETGMHYIGSALPGQTMNTVMRYFGMEGKVRLYSLDRDAYNTVCLEGERFRYASGRENFIATMSSYFPGHEDELRRYVSVVDSIAAASSLSSLTSSERDIAANTQYQTLAMDSVLEELISEPMLRNVLAGDLPLYSAERGKTPFSQHAFIMDFYNNSAFRIAGGSDSIATALVEDVELHGGEVLTGKKAVRIRCNDVKATGVETLDGCFYEADYVISAIHPARMLELLDTKLIRPAFRTRINSISQTSGVFAVYVKFRKDAVPYMNTNFFGYRGSSPWDCDHYTAEDWPKGFLYMQMCPRENPVWAESGVVLSYMDFAEVEKWKGTKVGRRGEEYEAFKRSRAEVLLAEVERQCPGFLAGVEQWWTSTPLTYLDYTGTENGSMYGVAKDVTAGAAGRVPYRTKVPNLLLAGQNVNSHGILGVTVGTIVTCSALVPAGEIYRQIMRSGGEDCEIR